MSTAAFLIALQVSELMIVIWSATGRPVCPAMMSSRTSSKPT
jgi:hypothetical protein